MKKFFIKICKFFGFEIIDQNEFTSPTLKKELNEDLSILNQKSIVLPLGEVKITLISIKVFYFYTSEKNSVFFFFSLLINNLLTYLWVQINKYYEKTIF